MVNTTKKPRITRLASLLLALVMVLSMFPVTAFAATDSIMTVDKDGNAKTEFLMGEPVYVKAVTDSSDVWVGMKNAKGNLAFWYYANKGGHTSGDIVNILETDTDTDPTWAGYMLREGTYTVFINGRDASANFTVKEPETKETSLSVNKQVLEYGEKLVVTATHYTDYSFVGIFTGKYTANPYENGASNAASWYYCSANNGNPVEYVLTPGEHTVALIDDVSDDEGTKYALCELINVTVKEAEEEVKILSTDKTEYKFGDPIMVTSMYGNPNWVGLYKQSDANPTSAGPVSIFWLYPTVGSAVNLLTGDSQRESDFVAGTYKVLLLDANYNVLASVENITITTEYDPSKDVRVEPKCGVAGSITRYNTDKTPYGEPEEIPALVDKFDGTPVYNNDKATHTYTCTQPGCTHTKSENCTFEYEVDTPAQNGVEGKGIYTCSVCNGFYYEVIPAKELDHEEIIENATCEKPGSKKLIYTDGTESAPIEIPQLTHKWSKWTYDEETGKHVKTCEHNSAPSCVVSENCSYKVTANKNVYACETCEHEEQLLTTNKTDYAYGEPILVSWNSKLYTPGSKDWIGFYWGGYTPSSSNAATYWGYANGTDEKFAVANGGNLIAHNNLGDGLEYQPSPTGGKIYTIYLLSNDSYNVVAKLDINVTTDWDASMVERVEPTCGEDGYQTYKYYKDGRPWPQDAPAKTILPATGEHTYEVYTPDNNATCTDLGTKSSLCSTCSKSTDIKTDENSTLKEHFDSETDNDHICDTCDEVMNVCVDTTPKDHKCDVCGETLSNCADNDNNHKCDTCSKELSKCADNDKNHKCDVCEGNVGKHEDTNKDHSCEYGCDGIIGKCVDENNDHKCDYGCSASFGVCEDTDKDGKCDYGCDKKFETTPEDPTDPVEPGEDTKIPAVEGTTRLAGDNRLITSYLVADMLKDQMGVEKFNAVIVASGGTFADALPGSYLSAVKNAPILLTLAKDKFINQTADYIKANLVEGGTVYILGGESAVPASMEKALAGFNVQRVAGADRFGTNLEILKTAGVKAGDEVLVCEAKGYADSLSASATGKPVLLVYKKLTAAQKEYLATLSGCKFTVVGGTSAIPENLAKEIEAYGSVTRLAGKDRLETSTMVADKYFGSATTAVVAYGWDFPDGLCGGSLAYAMKAPLILTHSKEKLYGFTAAYTTKAGITDGFVLGGDGLVSDAATKAIFGMTSGDITVVK